MIFKRVNITLILLLYLLVLRLTIVLIKLNNFLDILTLYLKLIIYQSLFVLAHPSTLGAHDLKFIISESWSYWSVYTSLSLLILILTCLLLCIFKIIWRSDLAYGIRWLDLLFRIYILSLFLIVFVLFISVITLRLLML